MAKEFTVENIAQRVRLTPAGDFVEVYEVTFRTAGGIVARKDIPVDRFNPTEVEAILREEATKLDAVRRL